MLQQKGYASVQRHLELVYSSCGRHCFLVRGGGGGRQMVFPSLFEKSCMKPSGEVDPGDYSAFLLAVTVQSSHS